MINDPQKILITRTDRIGDVMLSTPVFSAVKKAYPRAQIYACVLPQTAPLLENNPSIDRIIVYDKRGAERSMLQSMRFAARVRKEAIAIAIHLHPTNRMHMISALAGIPIRIGYRKKCGWLLTHALDEHKAEGRKHEAQYNFDLLAILGIAADDDIMPQIYLTAQDEHALTRALKECSLDMPADFVVLAPHASCPSKLWPAECFARLAAALYKEYQITSILIGGNEARAIAGDIVAGIKTPVIDLTGVLTLRMLGVLCQKARVVVSNDSGPVHIASAVGVPVISLFGRNDPGLSPVRWRPLGNKSYYIHKDVGCTVCYAHKCTKGFNCLQAITVEDVLTLLKQHRILPS